MSPSRIPAPEAIEFGSTAFTWIPEKIPSSSSNENASGLIPIESTDWPETNLYVSGFAKVDVIAYACPKTSAE